MNPLSPLIMARVFMPILFAICASAFWAPFEVAHNFAHGRYPA